MAHPYCPDVPTLVALIRWRAVHQPERIGYTFLADGERDERNLTYAELDRRARAVAVWLAANGAGRGERVLVLVEESLDYLVALFGCMYAGALAVPVHPPDPARLARTLPRLLTIAENAGVAAVLTSHDVFVASRAGLSEIPVLARAAWLAVDTDLEAQQPDSWVDPQLGPDDLAYLQYTSGSTATPKGVMVSHRNLLHQLTDFDTGYAHDPDAVLVSWLPATHDLGLVYARFMPLFIGMRCVFFSPVAFMGRPARWLEAVTRYRGTHTPSPNFGFELAARKVTAAEKRDLDLSSLRVVLNGAEPIRQESERLFQEAFSPCGLSDTAITHAMGMSEATAKILTEPIDRSPARFLTIDGPAYERNEVVVVPEGTPRSRQVASNGTTLLDTRVVIVDPERKVKQADGRVGEMWVAGTTVAQGYWNNPEATEAMFRAHTLDGDGPFLRTGDLAFVHDGEVYLTGRLKDVLIIRGQNHHPQDLEWTLATAHKAIRPNCAAVFAVVDDGRDQLVVVTEVATVPLAEPAPVLAAIRQAISEEHGLVPTSIVLIAPRALPKTSSGKIQRGRARELFVAGELDIVARWDA
ncbi:MAG: fatty acyl-AMP ligase, partial [Deltaproteobacteria bacterium]|nr:fatty acyl-AMP ligase [Deltaproteobacteria bacterium]